MKYLAILALLLIWQRSASGAPNDMTTASPQTWSPQIDDVRFSPRLLAVPINQTTPIKGTENPVILTRKLLLDLKLYNLVNEVVQAKLVTDTFGNGLLFEMGSGLQASEVATACVDQPSGLCKQLQVVQVQRGFLDSQGPYSSAV